jgi:signal transduction histidine kinase
MRRFLRALGRAGFLIILTVLLVNTVISFWNSSRIAETEELVASSQDVRLAMWRVLSALQDAETGQRGFLLTGLPEYLEPYRAARAEYDKNIADLKSKLAGDAETAALMKDFDEHVDRELDELAATIALRYERGQEAARDMMLSNTGQQEMDSIRKIMAQLRDIERGRSKERAETARSTIATARMTTVVAGLLSLVLLSAGYYAATTSIISETRADALDTANRNKDEFMAMLAHELRHPLAPLRAALEELETECLDQGETQQLHRTMQRQVSLLARLVEDLHDVSRVANGKVALDLKPIDLTTAVSSAVEMARPRLEAKQHQLTVSIASDPMQLKADVDRLSQAVANLLINAAKYSERGRRIWLSVDREGAEAAIRIRDEGIGIAPDMLERIFEIFTQADCSFRNPEGGLGLGLYLTKNLIEMHGGAIRAHSAGPGQGSEFVIRLPLSRGQALNGEQAERAEECDRNDPRRAAAQEA